MSELIKREVVLELLKYWKHLDAYDKIAEMDAVRTKQIKYFDEDERVWKIGSVIVDGEREGE